MIQSEDTVTCVTLQTGLLGGHKIGLSRLNLSTGKTLDQPQIPSDNEISSEESILFAGNNGGVPLLIWTDKSSKNVKVYVIGARNLFNVAMTSSNGEQIEKIVAHVPRSREAEPRFLLHYQTSTSNWADVFERKSKDSLYSKAFSLPVLDGQGAFSSSSQGSNIYFTRHLPGQVLLTSSSDPKPLNQWQVNIDQNLANPDWEPVSVTSEVLHRGGSKYSLRSAIVLRSGDWRMIRNGEVLWVRPESLTGVVGAAFIDSVDSSLLEELATENQQGLLGAFIRRTARHLNELQFFPRWFRSFLQRNLESLLADPINFLDSGFSTSSFGLNKLVLVATEAGRIAALDAGNQGNVLWNTQAVKIAKGESWNVLHIEPQEGSALVRSADGRFLRIYVRDGSNVGFHPTTPASSPKTAISVTDATGRNALIPVMNDGSLGEVPDVDFQHRTIITTQGASGTLRGWTLGKKGKHQLIWTYTAGPHEKILSAVPRPIHDPVASVGKALGDRNVLYKYLNPNILLVTTAVTEEKIIRFDLLDSVSGDVLYSTSQSNVDFSLPLSSTISENWFAYSVFAEAKVMNSDSAQSESQNVKGYQLVVSELFESPFPNDRGPFGDLLNMSSLHPVPLKGGRLSETPHVLSQTFLLPGPISHMSTTSTLQGITPRALLCTIPQLNSLISIPKYVLEPRRPVGRDPTPAEAEEGLFRYNPLLEFEPKWMLNHKREIFGIKSVTSSPSDLESTSLVFAYGDLDLFGTRVSPIGSFDILGKGFSKLQLVLTVAALAVGTALLSPYVRTFFVISS